MSIKIEPHTVFEDHRDNSKKKWKYDDLVSISDGRRTVASFTPKKQKNSFLKMQIEYQVFRSERVTTKTYYKVVRSLKRFYRLNWKTLHVYSVSVHVPENIISISADPQKFNALLKSEVQFVLFDENSKYYFSCKKRTMNYCKSCGSKYYNTHNKCVLNKQTYYSNQIQKIDKLVSAQFNGQQYRGKRVPETTMFVFYDIESHSSRQVAYMLVAHVHFASLIDPVSLPPESEVYKYFCRLEQTYPRANIQFFDTYVKMSFVEDLDQLDERNTHIDSSDRDQTICGVFIEMMFDIIDTFSNLDVMMLAYNGNRYDEVFLIRSKFETLVKKDNVRYKFSVSQGSGKLIALTVENKKMESLLYIRDPMVFVPSFSCGKSLRAVAIEVGGEVKKGECPFTVIDAFLDGDYDEYIDVKTGFILFKHFKHLTYVQWFKLAVKYKTDWLGFIEEYCDDDVKCLFVVTAWVCKMWHTEISLNEECEDCYRRVLSRGEDIFAFVSLAQLTYELFSSYMLSVGEMHEAPRGVYEEFVRGSLIGGRVTGNTFGTLVNGPMAIGDICSMYPSCLNSPIPCGQTMEGDNTFIKMINEKLKNKTFKFWEEQPFIAVAVVKKKLSSEVYENCSQHGWLSWSPLGLRHEDFKNGGLCWPAEGEFCVNRNCVDLYNLMKTGWEVELIFKDLEDQITCLKYEKWGMGVSGYCRYWFKLKKNAPSSLTKNIAKLLLNAMYGKNLQSSQFSEYIVCTDDFFQLSENIRNGMYNAEDVSVLSEFSGVGVAEIKATYERSRNTKCIHIGSFCLSYSRLMMQQIVDSLSKYTDRGIYTDTDSLVASFVAFKKWERDEPEYFGSELGGFDIAAGKFKYTLTFEGCSCEECAKIKHKNHYFDTFICLARKVYYLANSQCPHSEKIRNKGFPRNLGRDYFLSALSQNECGYPGVKVRKHTLQSIFFNKDPKKAYTVKSIHGFRTLRVLPPVWMTQCEKCKLFYPKQFKKYTKFLSTVNRDYLTDHIVSDEEM